MKKIVLVLLFAFSLFAGENEEIGVPYIDSNLGRINSAVLSHDGLSLFTLKEGVITQWQINSLQKQTSFTVKDSKEERFLGWRIHVTNDNSKIILQSDNELQLWDIQTKKLLQSVSIKFGAGTISKYGYITVDERELKIWDENTLRLANTISSFLEFPAEWTKTTPSPVQDWKDLRIPMNIIVGDNVVIIQYPQKRIYLDFETKVFREDLNKTEALREYGKSFCFEKNLAHLLLEIHNDPGVISYNCSVNDINELTSMSLAHKSRNLLRLSINHKKSLSDVRLYQFDDALLAELIFPGDSPFFIAPDSVKKHLKMKMKDGKILPMNDETFKKYNTPINLKAD